MRTLFGIDLTRHEGHDLMLFRRLSHDSSYVQNQAGDIIGINIRNQKDRLNCARITNALGLEHLQYLNLSDNEQLTELVFEIALPSLAHLDVSDSKIANLSFDSGFNALKRLDASRNHLNVIDFKGNLPSLEYLDLSKNQLTSLVLPAGFAALKYLYARKNQLSSFETQSELVALEILHLAENKLKNLPKARYTRLQTLYLEGNPLNYQEDLIKGDNSGNAIEVIGLLRAAYTSGESPNYYAKLIIVGNGRVGKTCMVKRLLGEKKCPKDLNYTHGISISELTEKNLPKINTNTDKLRLRVWDFGGQEVFYATHQFFLSEEAAYIYAWTDEEIRIKNQEEDTIKAPWQEHDYKRDHDYWLHNIRMHSKDSPILIVKTHSQDTEETLDYTRLNNVHQINHPPLDFDAESSDPKFLLNLQKALTSIVNELPILGTSFPNSYRDAINAIAVAKEDGAKELSKSAFDQLATKIGIEKGDEDKLLSYLRKTGEVIYFPQMEEIKNRIFIDPQYLTSQLYKLIEDHDALTQNNGNFTKQEAILKLDNKEDGEAFLALLIAFELVFEKKSEGRTTYIAPQYLKRNPDAFKVAKREKKLLFELNYPHFLPENVMINLLSHYGPYSIDEVHQNSIYFIKEKTDFGCIIETNFDKKRIKVYTGKEQQAQIVGKEVYEKLIELSKKTKIHIDVTGEEKWVHCKDLQNRLKDNRDIATIDGEYIDDKACFGFLNPDHVARGINLKPEPKEQRVMVNSKVIKTEIDQLVGRGRLEPAISLLTENLEGENKNEVLQLKSRLSSLNKEKRMGTISTADANVEHSKIVSSVLSLKAFIGDEEPFVKPIPIPQKRGIGRTKQYRKEATNIIDIEMNKNARSFTPFKEVEGKTKILFLTATPKDAGQLNTGKESRFKDLFRYFDEENKFEVIGEHGITSEQFQNFIISEDPHIVHYGGHGETEGIVLEDDDLDGQILADIVELSDNVQCVILNACYSLTIARKVAKVIPFVIGTQGAINDESAIAFARGFYMGIVSGQSVEKAFKLGVISIKREELPDADIPILVKGVQI